MQNYNFTKTFSEFSVNLSELQEEPTLFADYRLQFYKLLYKTSALFAYHYGAIEKFCADFVESLVNS